MGMAASQTAKVWSSLPRSTVGNTKDQTAPALTSFYICLVTTLVAFGVDLGLGTFASEATDALYIMAAASRAYAGGWRLGLLSLLLGLLPNIWLHNSPHYSLAVVYYGWERLVMNTGIGAVLAWVVGRLHREQLALRTLNDELDERVRQRTADVEESNRQLEAFCYTLAHDLRAPLRAIEGFSHITAENAEDLTDDTRQTLARVGKSAATMGRLINDLLVYTQLHRTDVPLAKTNLQEVVERVVEIVSPEVEEKHASIEIENTLPTVNANSALMEQILLSIVSNALRFSRPQTRPQVRIRSDQEDGFARITIEDNGIGIAPQHQHLIFQPFHRLNPAEIPDGTGMGLALAKKGVEKLGGKMGVNSQVNRGSRFWVELRA
jgi:signal transduction histidine kinase